VEILVTDITEDAKEYPLKGNAPLFLIKHLIEGKCMPITSNIRQII
jgi:hypothetical protein